MLKKIPVSKLKLGMTVCEINPHPKKFASSLFETIITHQSQLEQFQKTNIEYVHIKVRDKKHLKTVSLQSELKQAKTIKKDSIQIIKSFMNDIRLGKQVSIEYVTPLVSQIVQSIIRNEEALLTLIQLKNKDQYTYEHSLRTSVLLTVFAKQLGYNAEELNMFCMGGFLLDIGKAKVPLSILSKPSMLNAQELAAAQQHIKINYKLIEELAIDSETVIQIMTEHHERLDGSGYPCNKTSSKLSLAGQMAAIVDTYDACASDRVYKKATPPHKILQNFLYKQQLFDNSIVNIFIHCIGIYPISSFVSLSNGQLALVIGQTEKGLLYPNIRIIFDSVKRVYIDPIDIQLRSDADVPQIVGVEDPIKWGIDTYSFLINQ